MRPESSEKENRYFALISECHDIVNQISIKTSILHDTSKKEEPGILCEPCCSDLEYRLINLKNALGTLKNLIVM